MNEPDPEAERQEQPMQRVFATGVFARLPIRWRLSLWYGGVLVIILVGFAATIYGMMRSHLEQRTDQELLDELSEVQDEIEHARSREELRKQLERRFGDDANHEYQVTGDGGVVVFRSRSLGNQALPIPEASEANERRTETVQWHGNRLWRVATRRIHSHDGDLLAQVAASVLPDREIQRSLLGMMAVVGPLAICAALAGGYFLARRALEPVDRMVATASEITATRLDRRLKVGDSADELSRLAAALNKMIERLDQSFRDMQRFASDAAHELRTPLAIIRNAADVSLGDPNTPSQCRGAFEDILEESQRLARIADELLYLTRHDSGIATDVFEPLRFDLLAADVVDHLRLVAEENSVSIEAGPWKACVVNGDADQLRRLVLNLLDNAIKFTPAGGHIAIDIVPHDDRVVMSVRDDGIGVAPEHLPYIFDRFYRVDSARNREQGGAGLGLAICKSIVQSHDGRISAESTLGRGTCVRVELPRRIAK